MRQTLEAVRNACGQVIPIWYSRKLSDDEVRSLFLETIAGVAEFGSISDLVAVSDGDERGAAVIEEIRRAQEAEQGQSFSILSLPENRGKGAAVREGMRFLLARPHIRYLAIRDNDGDHSMHDLIGIVRGVMHAAADSGNPLVMGIGRRSDVHRPLGYARGQFEELVCRMTLDMIQWHAARTGRAVPLQYCSIHGEWIDLHSGFKVFTRESAEAVFRADPPSCGLAGNARDRHAVEVVLTVENHLAGGIVAEIRRNTYNEQPTTTFGEFNRAEMSANMLAWPAIRLEIPAEVVEQFFWNRVHRLTIPTIVPDGKAECEAILKAALVKLGIPSDATIGRAAAWPGPRFL
ncbi:MAG TPA: hypothetical protein PL033_02130 [Candidatus Brocadiia bacterium]|nr:hypothetical protein [Candidatus Brocadiia bacterium]